MLYVYSALAGGAVGALIAVLSYKLGAKAGGERAIRSIMEAFHEQQRVEADNKEKEKRDRIAYVQDIISSFLMKEIDRNYESMDLSGKKNLPIGTEFQLEFDVFDKTKYILLENPTRAVREIFKLYALFDDITRLNDTSQVQEKLKKLDEIIEQREVVDILLHEVRYMRVK